MDHENNTIRLQDEISEVAARKNKEFTFSTKLEIHHNNKYEARVYGQ